MYFCKVCGQELRPNQRHREADCARRLSEFARRPADTYSHEAEIARGKIADRRREVH